MNNSVRGSRGTEYRGFDIRETVQEKEKEKEMGITDYMKDTFKKTEEFVAGNMQKNGKEITTVFHEVAKKTITLNNETIIKSFFEENVKVLNDLFVSNTSLQVLLKKKEEIVLKKDNKKIEKCNEKIKEVQSKLITKYQVLLKNMKNSMDDLTDYIGENSNVNINLISQLIDDIETTNTESIEKINMLSEEIELLNTIAKEITNGKKTGNIHSIEKQIARKEEKIVKTQQKLYETYENGIQKCNEILVNEGNFLTRNLNFLRKDWQALMNIIEGSSSFLVIHGRVIEHFRDPKKAQSIMSFVIVSIYAILLETATQLGKSTAIGFLALTTFTTAVEAYTDKTKDEDKARGIGPEANTDKLKLMNERVKKFKEKHLTKFSELLKENPLKPYKKDVKHFHSINELNINSLTKDIQLIERKQIDNPDNINTLAQNIEKIISKFM